jgi:Sulfotransferase domain
MMPNGGCEQGMQNGTTRAHLLGKIGINYWAIARFVQHLSLNAPSWLILFKAVCDLPPAAFAEELIAAYPEAKVVILNRDVDKWYESMQKTILKHAPMPTPWGMVKAFLDWRETGQIGMMMGKLMGGLFGPGGMTESNMKRFFIEYHENLRRILPKERLLEMKIQDGYKPLCNFLGVPIPTKIVDEKEVEEAFPMVNESAIFVERLVIWRRIQNRRIMKKVGTFVSVVGMFGAGLWFLLRR